MGLPNLRVIRNGGVRISENPSLCFVVNIDWKRLTFGQIDDVLVSDGESSGQLIIPSSLSLSFSSPFPSTFYSLNSNLLATIHTLAQSLSRFSKMQNNSDGKRGNEVEKRCYR